MKKLFKDYFSVIFGTGFSRGISFIIALILARQLSVEGFGKFSMFFTVLMLAWQIPAIIDAVYVRYAKAGKEGERHAYLRIAVRMKLWILLFLLAAGYPLAGFLSVYVFHKPELVVFLVLAIVSGGFLSILSSLAGIYQAEERFMAFSIVNSVFYAGVFLVVLVFFLFKFPLTAMNAAVIFGVVSVVVGVLACAYLMRRIRPGTGHATAHAREMFDFGKWLFAESLVYIFLQRLDILFLGRFAGYAEIGVYSAAVRIAMVASILTGAATAIFMPRGCQSLKSQKHLRDYFKEASVATAALSALIVVLILAAPTLVESLFGKEYIQAVVATKLLLLEAVFVLLYTPVSFLFYANGESKKIFVIGVSRFAVMVVSLSVLVPVFGATGAAVSICVSSLVGFLAAAALAIGIIRRGRAADKVSTEFV